ncbi:MAG: hypothetical protein ACRD3P_00775 [Terriglobales bacterium]
MGFLGGGIGALGSIVGGILGSSAAKKAADAEAQGATQSEHIINQGTNNATNFLNGEWQGTKNNFQPYLDLGATSSSNLAALLGKGFQAPTLEQAEQTPGYQFTLQQGTNAINQNAAANGTLLSGNTGKALTDYGQGLAQNSYQQVYGNAMQSYLANLQGLLGGTQIGAGATSSLGALGGQAAGTMGNIQQRGAEDAATQNNNIATARASGYLGSANAWSKAIGGITGGLTGGFGNMSGDSSLLENFGNFAMGAG